MKNRNGTLNVAPETDPVVIEAVGLLRKKQALSQVTLTSMRNKKSSRHRTHSPEGVIHQVKRETSPL